MDVTTFFSRLLQPPKQDKGVKQPDDINDFDSAWTSIKATLQHPDERQLARGIESTDVPARLAHIVDALVYEAGHTDEDTTGSCLEYLLRNDMLANLERLSETDRPRGIKGQVLRTINNLIISLSERFLVHNAVHRPLRRLLKSCVGDEPGRKDGERVFGAAGMENEKTSKIVLDRQTEVELLDLMCTLTSRMRVYPPLLLIFFHDKGWLVPHPTSVPPPSDPSRPLSPTPSAKTSVSHPSSRHTGTAHHFEFLLFTYLLRFAHREGSTGDTARAGLLFLFDIAFLTETEEGGDNLYLPSDKDGNDILQEARDALGEFILEGDFTDVMAAGLGAIWSLLPSKLRVPTLAEVGKSEGEAGITASQSGGMHLGATLDEKENEDELRSSTDPEVQNQLDLLIKLLGFLQDIFQRCESPIVHATPGAELSNPMAFGQAIIDYTLDAVSTSFLDNVIYPSILECSSTDGSAVAVMTYLEVIISNLDEGKLSDRLLGVLMDTEDPSERKRRREGAQEYYADEGRFTLKDLILDNIQSPNSEASTAAFRLLKTLLSTHCHHSVQGLIRTIRDPAATTSSHGRLDPGISYLPRSTTSTDVNLQEVELYGSLISRIDPLQTSSELASGYAAYLTDVHALIQANTCFVDNQIPLSFSEEEDDLIRVGTYDKNPFRHRVSPGDPLVTALLEALGHFMCQSPDANVALTGVLTSIALCPNRSLGGWLVYDAPKEPDPWVIRSSPMTAYDSENSEDDEPVTLPGSEDPFTAREKVDLPALYQVLRDLVRQVNRFRLDVDDFDRLLSERRQGLLFADHLDEAMNVLLDVEPSVYGLPATPSKVESPTPKRARPGIVGGIRSFLTPKRKTSPATPNAASPMSAHAVRQAAGDIKSTSPFKSHYEQTSYFSLEAHTSSPIASGPWSPARLPKSVKETLNRSKSAMSGTDGVSVFSGQEDLSVQQADLGPKKVTLSSVLDNCVVLEEFLKEIVAVITARRALGVDQVSFV